MCLYECLFIYLFYIIDFFCDLLFFKNLFVRFALTKYKLQLFSQSHYVHKEEEEKNTQSSDVIFCLSWTVILIMQMRGALIGGRKEGGWHRS